MLIAGSRPLIERAEQQYVPEQVAIASCRPIAALQIHHVPEKGELADTTSSADLEQATSRG